MKFTTRQAIRREIVIESEIEPDSTADRKLGAVLYRPQSVRAIFAWQPERGWTRERLGLTGRKVLKSGEVSKVGDVTERLWNDTTPPAVRQWADDALAGLDADES
jgi:hypothetical protein